METQMDIGQTSKASAQVRSTAGKQASTFDLTKRLRVGEEIIRVILLFCGVVSIFTTIGIIYVLAEESLLFFDSRAWTIERSPVRAEEPSAELSEPIEAGERQFTLSFEGSRIPFNLGTLIQIGDEIMLITDRGSSTIRVDRGVEGTSVAEHSPDEPVYAVEDQQVRLAVNATEEDTLIQIPNGFSKEFSEGQLLQIGTEILRIEAITPAADVEGFDSLTVERGVDDSIIRAHEAGDEQLRIAHTPSLVEFLTFNEWQPQIGNFGIWPLLLSTLIVSGIALLVSIPLGLGAAIFLSEYADPQVRNVLKPILEVLAGVPTVVYGFFALTFVTPGLQAIFGNTVQFYNMLAAGMVVGVLIIPLVSSLSEDALSAVPRALREASFGLGATKLETTVKVVLPAAVSGVMSAIIIAMSRAIGETMIVAIAAGSGPNFTFNIFEGAETMTGHMARISGGDLSYGSIDYTSIFAIGALLFIVTLILNIFSSWISNRLREAY